MHTLEQAILRDLVLTRNGVPIYVQIREQLLQAIGAGRLPPGARMPTMRQVAVALNVDLNTVRHAYEDLQRDGVIALRQGQGSFVMKAPISVAAVTPPGSALGGDRLDELARRAIAQATDAGLDPLILAARIAGLVSSKESLS
jgi:GntR family transcriptional regulator